MKEILAKTDAHCGFLTVALLAGHGVEIAFLPLAAAGVAIGPWLAAIFAIVVASPSRCHKGAGGRGYGWKGGTLEIVPARAATRSAVLALLFSA